MNDRHATHGSDVSTSGHPALNDLSLEGTRVVSCHHQGWCFQSNDIIRCQHGAIVILTWDDAGHDDDPTYRVEALCDLHWTDLRAVCTSDWMATVAISSLSQRTEANVPALH